MLETQRPKERAPAASATGNESARAVAKCAQNGPAGSPAPQRNFPFSAVVGQEDMKLALVLAAIDPSIGGVLIMGDRGAGKSTCVRGLATLLPTIAVVSDCAFNCDPLSSGTSCGACQDRAEAGERVSVVEKRVPVIDLPIGATEDRVVGSLDIEQALVMGKKQFEPGLLAKANRGFLYIDEVNLLDDHLVDLLLDVAASGENLVEREGLSVRHPARFVLVGSGNPEEGDLRPQLLDRFGLCVEVASPRDVDVRVEAVKRRDAFDRDPEAFVVRWAESEQLLRERIVDAQEGVLTLEVSDSAVTLAAKICLQLGTDGLRGELTLIRTARSLAAYLGADEVTDEHIVKVAVMALAHRLRKDPLDDTSSAARIELALDEIAAA